MKNNSGKAGGRAAGKGDRSDAAHPGIRGGPAATLILALILVFAAAMPVPAQEPGADGDAKPATEVIELGERMYREGILPSGEPMEALVQRDIPVQGTMFTCDNCHLRSGLGSAEGTIVTLPTNGAKLYRPLRVGAEIETVPARSELARPFQGGDIRPAYTDATLADALRYGVTPNGRELDWTMPRYLLDDRDMEIMVTYLKNLSAEFSPGVDATEIRFATVVSDQVPQDRRDAMLRTLQAVVRDRNAQSRHQEARARKGPFYKQEKYTAYRRSVLEVWELTGPRNTWARQLEEYYRQDPVFALLGGIVTGDWSPVHAFCERRQIPCLFPITDLPVVAEDDWYTLYFSKGYYQEGEAAARYLTGRDLATATPVVQIVADTAESRLLAEGFRQTLEGLGRPLAAQRIVDREVLADPNFWKGVREGYPEAVLALWAGPEVVPELPVLAAQSGDDRVLFLSTSLLGEERRAIPEKVRDAVYLTHPHRLPRQKAAFEKTVRSWLKIREVPVTDITIQSKVYFLGWMMTGATRMMGNDFYRDYLLDVLDMMRDETYAIMAYPRVSFGPGQRYAAKGCYIVRLGPGPEPALVPVSNWVVH